MLEFIHFFLQSAFCLDSETKAKSKHESVHGILGKIKFTETFDFHSSENLILFPPRTGSESDH